MDGCTAIIFFKYVGVVCAAWYKCSIAGDLSQQSNNRCVRTALCTMTKLGWRQFWHALQKWLLNSHPWPNMNDHVPHERKMNMLSCTEISFVIRVSFFNSEKFWVKPGFPFMQLNRANTQNLENFNFDMFYYCWAVIPDPIWTTSMYHMKEKWICYHVLKSVLLYMYLFSILRNFESNRGFLLCNSIELHIILKTWEILILTCFTKIIAEQSSVGPMCVTNASYEREIMVLSFPVISFVILIFAFLRFEIRSGFPFFWLTLYNKNYSLALNFNKLS